MDFFAVIQPKEKGNKVYIKRYNGGKVPNKVILLICTKTSSDFYLFFTYLFIYLPIDRLSKITFESELVELKTFIDKHVHNEII